jgi:hypothetical protein
VRVFLGLAEVSGFYTNLKKGFNEIGIDAELITLTNHRFNYETPSHSFWVKIAQYSVNNRIKYINANLLTRIYWSLLVFITRLCLFIWCLIKFDVFIFGCATSFFKFHDLPILAFFKKKIIYNFHGTDGRCGFMDGFAEDTFLPEEFKEKTGYIGPIRETDSEETKKNKLYAYMKITKHRYNNLKKIERYAHFIINSPSHGQHHSKPFIQRLIIGMPYMLNKTLSEKHKEIINKNRHVTILHCPSYLEGKGSYTIRKAIQSLKQKGHLINYVEVTGRPNSEVLELILECDFVIDQLYSDMAMVGFATEAAFYGKPAIVGGYYTNHQEHDIQSEWIPPTLFCLPEDIESSIEKLILDLDFRNDLGSKAKQFVESKWQANMSAYRLVSLVNGDYPKAWLYNPVDCDYILGMGMSKDNVRVIMRGIYHSYGVSSFMLSDKPMLEKQIVQFINEPDTNECNSI